MRVTIISLILLVSLLAKAQNTDTTRTEWEHKHAITVSSFHFVAGMLKVNYDFLGMSKHYSIGVSPFLIIVDSSSYTDMFGTEVIKSSYGVDLNNKFYLHPNNDLKEFKFNFYLNLAFRVQRMEFSYNKDIWTPFTTEGAEYYQLRNRDITAVVDRFGFVPQIGTLVRLNRIQIEPYVGLNFFSDKENNNVGDAELRTNDFHELNRAVTVNGSILGLSRAFFGINFGLVF